MSSKLAWFPFYVNDWLTDVDVARMNSHEIKGYIMLLCHAWTEPDCSLPDDEESLKSLSRLQEADIDAYRNHAELQTFWEMAKSAILCKFVHIEGMDPHRLYNRKLLDLHIKAREEYEAKARGGRSRAYKTPPKTPPKTLGKSDTKTAAATRDVDVDVVSVVSSSEVKLQEQQTALVPDSVPDFMECGNPEEAKPAGYDPMPGWEWFVSQYPKHRLNPNRDCRIWLSVVTARVEEMIRDVLPKFKASTEWANGVIPSAKTWLSEHRWLMMAPPAGKSITAPRNGKKGNYVSSADWESMYGEKEGKS